MFKVQVSLRQQAAPSEMDLGPFRAILLARPASQISFQDSAGPESQEKGSPQLQRVCGHDGNQSDIMSAGRNIFFGVLREHAQQRQSFAGCQQDSCFICALRIRAGIACIQCAYNHTKTLLKANPGVFPTRSGCRGVRTKVWIGRK